MIADSHPRFNLGDGSLVCSQKTAEPGSEVAVVFPEDPGLRLYQSVVLISATGENYLAAVRGMGVYELGDVPENELRSIGFPDLYHLAEVLRHRRPEMTWHDRVTVVHLYIYEGCGDQ